MLVKVDWFWCAYCGRDVEATLSVDIEETIDTSRTVRVCISARCTECDQEITSESKYINMFGNY